MKLAMLTDGRVSGVLLRQCPDWPESSEDTATRLLGQMVRQLHSRSEDAWGSIQGAAIITHLSEFPQMQDSELRGAVALEAEEFMSRDMSEVDIDYQVVETMPDRNVRVLFVAAPKHLSDRRMRTMEEAGLRCTGVTTDSVSLASLFLTANSESQEAVVLVNVGALSTNIVSLVEGKPSVLRDIDFGGNDFTVAITKQLGVSYEEAEEMKKSVGSLPPQVIEAVQNAAEPLTGQITRTIEYLARQMGESEPPTVYLLGGGSLAEGLDRWLAGRLQTSVQYMDPFSGLEVDCQLPTASALRSCYGVALGNALLGGFG